MRPRFSLLTLLGITAYLAIAQAGLMFPGSIWNRLIVYGWALIIVWLGLLAFSERSPRSAFAGGFLVTVLAYAAAAVFDPSTPFLTFSAESRPKLPHVFLFDFLVRNLERDSAEFWRNETQYRRWALANASLACGVLGGWLTQWRYRVLERRAKEKVS